MSKEITKPTEANLTSLVVNDYQTNELENIKIDVSHLVTEDDALVDNMPSEKHQRLLTSSLYNGWDSKERKFLASANVAIYNSVKQSPIVPDMFISLDVEIAEDWWKKENCSYFVWEFGKPPDLVIEIVSNKVGGENSTKINRYAHMKVDFYIIYDPQKHIMNDALTVYALKNGAYQLYPFESEDLLPNLRIILWEGEFEGKFDTWLRWADSNGNLVLTGTESAAAERIQKEVERIQKEAERAQKEQALKKAERLAAKLKELGIDPETL